MPRPDAAPLQAPFACVLPADPAAVRDGLLRLLRTPPLSGLPQDQRSRAEVVLAEVLNNITEHAYAGSSGDISVTLWREGSDLVCRIEDRGGAMPGGQPPSGTLPDIRSLADHDLPEGGFGWHLVHALTDRLQYVRIDNRNQLDFVIPANPGAAV